jgi:hypothetical protein
MIQFGIELADGVPPDDEWLPKIRWMEKHSNLDLSEYDLDDELDKEFVYKALFAVSGIDLMMVTMKSGMADEEVSVAMDGFRSIQESGPDQGSEPAPSG